ncbi:MAG: hypothetical protein IJB49_09125 [Clostridia bacterium]|nr:hypothetical protein [Clostridia bacterium]
MKKILSLVLVTLFILSFTACGGDEDVRGTISTVSGASETAESSKADENNNEFAMGTTNGSVYENSYIGIGCRLDSDWTFYTDEQIKELNQITADKGGEEFAEIMENADIVYDMFVQKTNGDNMNVNLEKVNAITLAALDMSTFYNEEMKKTLKQSLESVGCTNVEMEDTEVVIDGKKFVAVKITSEMSGVKMYQTNFAIKCSKHIASICITTMNGDSASSIIEKFYIAE